MESQRTLTHMKKKTELEMPHKTSIVEHVQRQDQKKCLIIKTRSSPRFLRVLHTNSFGPTLLLTVQRPVLQLDLPVPADGQTLRMHVQVLTGYLDHHNLLHAHAVNCTKLNTDRVIAIPDSLSNQVLARPSQHLLWCWQ